MRALKSLGQHFLTNVHAAERIVALLELQPADQVLEIGGGRGVLTEFLLDRGARVTCVEIDQQLAQYLSQRFSDRTHFHLVRDDIRNYNPTILPNSEEGVKLIGNIPYKISSAIVEWLVGYRSIFSTVVLTVQKEVADRIVASPGGKNFGSLTVFVQLFYKAERMFLLRPGSFTPPPKVTSAVIRLQRLTRTLIDQNEYSDLRRLTAACFRWRRKQLCNILTEEYALDKTTVRRVLEVLSVEPTTRPERVTVAAFVELARKLRCHTAGSL